MRSMAQSVGIARGILAARLCFANSNLLRSCEYATRRAKRCRRPRRMRARQEATMPDMDWEKSLHGGPPENAALVDGGAVVGRTLREAGVRHLFAINGGHTFPILGALRANGVMLVH